LEKAGSTDPEKIRQALADIKMCSGPGAIFSYKCIDFDKDGQNKNAALVVVQIHDDNGTMKRFSIWPKAARHAGFTPTFPMK
ncbi:MAG: ABC transporter substrate-binding protein, partial [Xanthomonadaceae bacterium]|nr:ABC transporter substrate-binding protein [Xanthomonadaceae bacterium]